MTQYAGEDQGTTAWAAVDNDGWEAVIPWEL